MMNDKPLKDWAAENKVSYWKARRDFLSNGIDGAYQTKNKRIYVREAPQPVAAQPTKQKIQLGMPDSAVLADENLVVASTSTRTNRSAVIQPIAQYQVIDQLLSPFTSQTSGSNNSNISMRDAFILCQKLYWGISIVRLVVDVLIDFSASQIYFTGINKKAIEFFDAYFKQINLADFIEQFFLEFYRSGNCIIYRQDALWDEESISNLYKVLGISKAAKAIKLPARYIILNPAEITISGSSNFVDVPYFKQLTGFEINALKNKTTETDKLIYDSLSPEIKEAINKKNTNILFPLEKDKLYTCHNKKMSYEAFAVPPLYPLLSDVAHKLELKAMDRAVMRTTNQVVLLVKSGFQGKDGEYNFSQKVNDALKAIFENESVSRAIFGDFSVDAKFIVPEIADLLGPEKYEVVNQDIKESLANLLFSTGDSQFSNQQTKVRVFMEKIKKSRGCFLNNFLIPEIKRISKIMGFKNYVTPHFEDIEVENPTEWVRSITRIFELGGLTPDETFEAIETGRLPTEDESLEHQEKFKEAKDKGFYQPIVGGPKDKEKLAEIGASLKDDKKEVKGTPGRPSGTSAPKKPGEVGQGQVFSAKAIQNTITAYGELCNSIEKIIKKKHGLDNLNNAQKEIVNEIAEVVMANEDRKAWKNLSLVKKYVENPIDNPEKASRIQELELIKIKHDLDNFAGCLLLNSRKE